MEIAEESIGIFYVSKFLGLAPFSVKKASKGKFIVERSILFTVYSIALIIIMVSLTYHGLLFDANSKIPIRASFRMKSNTSKVVTSMDVSVVALATSSGVICALLGVRATKDITYRLNEIDELLIDFANENKEKLRGYLMLFIAMLTISIMLALDVWTWNTKAVDLKIDAETDLNIQWYIPFYSLYYILVAFHVQFANSCFGLARRYRTLNNALKITFLSDRNSNINRKGSERGKLIHHSNGIGVKILEVSAVKSISESSLTDPSLTLLGQRKNILSRNDASVINACKNSVLIDRFAHIHESLGKCVKKISCAYGMCVTFMLVSCLLHLVATAYFLILEIMGEKPTFSYLQFLWIFVHSVRLLLIVEPCHATSEECAKTIMIVSEIDRTKLHLTTSENLRKFWQQLLSDRTYFSACGMCKINRQILTSFSGAICTYLVILIQFQENK